VAADSVTDIVLLAAATGVSTVASMIQQIHTILWYKDLMREQFARKANYLENPELVTANGAFGLDLVLYYIRTSKPPGFRASPEY
jgi:hypothetical protein